MPLTGEYEPSPAQWVRDQVELYESSGGTEGLTLRGKPVIILTTKGAKSGKIRKTPLMRVEHDGSYAAVASLGGAPKHPVWYYNVLDEPARRAAGRPAAQGLRRPRGHRRGEGAVVGAGHRRLAGLRRIPAQDRSRHPRLRAGTRLFLRRPEP